MPSPVLSSPICWPGGKKNLLKTLLPLLPEHTTYVEPFCGSAKLLFAKEPSRYEVISDANGDLINFFLVLKYRPSELAEKLHVAVAHPHWFKKLRGAAKTEDEIERAFRFIYLNGLSFAGGGTSFGYCYTRPQPKKNLRTLAGRLSELSERLSTVLIEQCDFADMFRKYDSEAAFFYCDPPYVEFSSNGRYNALTPQQLDGLFESLANLKGKFLMSEENHPEVIKRVKQRGFGLREVSTTYSASKDKPKKVTELLISNYELKPF